MTNGDESKQTISEAVHDDVADMVTAAAAVLQFNPEKNITEMPCEKWLKRILT